MCYSLRNQRIALYLSLVDACFGGKSETRYGIGFDHFVSALLVGRHDRGGQLWGKIDQLVSQTYVES